MIYCPYTNRDLVEAETSREHIIPLALGGADGFELQVDAAENCRLGTEIDGRLANEFFTMLLRQRSNSRGHTGKDPVPVVKRATYGNDNRPAQLRLHREGARLWDAKDRSYRSGQHVVRINVSLNIDLPLRFTAKAALAAGYFVYGDLFRHHVDHPQLRDAMNIDPAKLDLKQGATALGLDHMNLRVDNYLHNPPTDQDSPIHALRLCCSAWRGSTVVLILGQASLFVAVGLLGQYLGMVNVPAETHRFPRDSTGAARGQVLVVRGGKLMRDSWVSAMTRIMTSDATVHGPSGQTFGGAPSLDPPEPTPSQSTHMRVRRSSHDS